MNLRKIFLPVLISIFISFNSFCQEWNLRTNSDGVKVYTRAISGSNFQEYKGEVTVNSNLGGILTLIDSVPGYTKWQNNCTYAERLKKINRESGYTYYVIKTPWPLTDRDVCAFYKVSQDTATKVVTIKMKGVKDYIPQKEGRVRVPILEGSWTLTPIAKGVTKIVYQVHSDPGGIVPAALINAYVTETPRYNLSNLKKIVESPLYPKIVMKGLKEME